MIKMCKCNECDKNDTENCIRVIESFSHQQAESLNTIELESLKCNYDNLLKGMEKMIQLIASESFWKVRDIEQRKE